MNQSAALPSLPSLSILQTLRRESGDYSWRKPGKVPPADSPTRPALAALWRAAQNAANKRRRIRTFGYAGHQFGIVYLDNDLYVTDWATCRILVRPPKSHAALDALLNTQRR